MGTFRHSLCLCSAQKTLKRRNLHISTGTQSVLCQWRSRGLPGGYQPLLPTEVSLAHERLVRVAVRVKIPARPGPSVRQLTATIALGLETPCLASVVSWISKTHARAITRAIVVDVQAFGLAVVCGADVELAWLFSRRSYCPDEAAISAWCSMQAVCRGMRMGLESIGWAEIIVRQRLRRHLVACQ